MSKEHKNILLICTAGITTGLLVRNMTGTAEQRGLDVHIYSAPSIVAKDVMKDNEIDAVLIGPQAEYEVARLEEYFSYYNIPYRLIKKETYQTLDGEKALEEALLLLDKE